MSMSQLPSRSIMNSAAQMAKKHTHNARIANLQFPRKLHFSPNQKRLETHHHGVKVIKLTDKDRHNIAKAATTVHGNPYKEKELEAFKKRSADALGKILGADIVKDLKGMNEHQGKNIALLIKNLPVSVNGLSETPKLGVKEPKGKSDFVSEVIMTGIADIIGGKIVAEDEPAEGDAKLTKEDDLKAAQNNKIEQIVPNKGINTVPTRFDIPRFMHIEEAHEVHQPDTLLLMTLRGDKNAKSAVVSVDKLINELDKKVVDALRKPDYVIYPEEGEGGEKMISPIIGKNDKGADTLRFHSDPKYARGLTAEAQDALTVMRAYLSNHRNVPRIALEDGDMLISDNKRALHGTYPYHNSQNDPKKNRWLQRSYLQKEY